MKQPRAWENSLSFLKVKFLSLAREACPSQLKRQGLAGFVGVDPAIRLVVTWLPHLPGDLSSDLPSHLYTCDWTCG